MSTNDNTGDQLENKTVLLVRDQLQDAKSTQGPFELPCGYLAEDGNVYTDVVVREIRGHEEDMLGNPKVPAARKMSELMSRCVERVGPFTDRGKIAQIVMDLIVGDRAFLIFAIRRVTLGDEFPFKDQCPECKKESLYVADLSELEVKRMPDPHKRLFDIPLPSGKSVRFRPMTGRSEEKLLKDGKAHGEDALSLAILARLELMDGKPVMLDDVKNLGMRDRHALRSEFETVEGGIETETDMTCPYCDHEFRKEIDVSQRSFFFPSAIPRNSKPKSST